MRLHILTNMTLNRLGFWVTAKGHFHFRNNETEDVVAYQSNPLGVELFSYVNTLLGLCYTFCAQKSRQATVFTRISAAALI